MGREIRSKLELKFNLPSTIRHGRVIAEVKETNYKFLRSFRLNAYFEAILYPPNVMFHSKFSKCRLVVNKECNWIK